MFREKQDKLIMRHTKVVSNLQLINLSSENIFSMLQVQMEADGTVSEVKVAHTGDPEVYNNKPTVYIQERYKLIYMYRCLIQDLINVVHVI